MSDALHPDIPLHVVGPNFSQLNPIESMGHLAVMQNQLNQARLFQQTFAAKMGLGAVIAGSPDLDSAFQNAVRSPYIAFAPEVATMLKGLQLADTQIGKQRQDMALTTIDAARKSMAGAYQNPAAFGPLISTIASTIPPGAAGEASRAALQNFGTAVTDGLGPVDSSGKPIPLESLNAQQRAQVVSKFQTNLVGAMTAAGMSPTAQEPVVGAPQTVQRGGQVDIGVRAPVSLGGGFSATTSLPMTQAPGYQAPGAVPVGGALGPYGTGLAAPSGASLSMSLPSASLAATPSPSGNIAVPPGAKPSIPLPVGVGGVTDVNANPQTKSLSTDFAEADRRAYESALTTQGNIASMSREFDTLTQKGGAGLLTPGGLAPEFRLSLAKGINSFYQMIHKEPPIAPDQVAAGEGIVKNMNQMRVSVLTQMLGTQREAAMTIASMEKAVPGLDNSVLGARLVMSLINASSQRVIDERNFKNDWSQKFGGNLSGADEAFNTQKPPTQYVNDAMSELGMTTQGFDSPESVRNAVHMGWILPSQGVKILENQWPQGHPAGAH